MATQWTAGLTDNTVLPASTLNTIGAAWETWTPTVTQSGNVTFTNQFSRYGRVQKLVFAQCYLTITGTGTANNDVIVSFPITGQNGGSAICAWGFIYDSSASTMYTVVGANASQTSARFYYTNASGNAWGVSPLIALANGDQIRLNFVYEAA